MRIAVWSVVVCVMTWGMSVRGSEAGSLRQGRIVRGLEGSVEIGRGSTIAGLAPVWRDWLNGRAGDGADERAAAAPERAPEMATEPESASSLELAQEAPADKSAEKTPRKGAGGRSSGAAANGTSGTPVNINTSSAEQLEALPGIGPSLAGRIVEYREKHGPFKRLEDLMNVQGVGEKSFQKLKPHINIGAAKAER